MLIDVNDKTKDEIYDHLIRVVGKTEYETLTAFLFFKTKLSRLLVLGKY